MKNGWGGIYWLDESFVERAHQEGVKEDRRTQGVKGHEAQQTAQFKAEERASNPKVEERALVPLHIPSSSTSAFSFSRTSSL